MTRRRRPAPRRAATRRPSEPAAPPVPDERLAALEAAVDETYDDQPLSALLAVALVAAVGRARTALDAEVEVSALLGPVAVASEEHGHLLAAVEEVVAEYEQMPEAEREELLAGAAERDDPPPPPDDDDEPVDEHETTLEVVDALRTSSSPDALAALRVLAAVGVPDVRDAAADAADRLAASGLADRPWARTVGAPSAQGAWAWSDEETGLDSLAVLYAERGREHVLLVVVDAASGGVADLGLISDRRRVDETLTSLRTTGGDTLPTERVPVEKVPDRLGRALAAPHVASEETFEDVTALWPLVRARARAVE